MGATIVGPAAPVNQDEPLDMDRYNRFSSMRDAVVAIGKRMNIQTEDPPYKPKKKKQRKSKRGGVIRRRKIGKRAIDTDKTLEAPSVPDDGGIDHYDVMETVISPPYSMHVLCALLENSSSLRPNIDAMVTNIDGYGHQFEPVLDFTAPDIDKKIRDILITQKIDEAKVSDLLTLEPGSLEEFEPTDEEVQKTKEFWQRIASIEKNRAVSFFKFINPLESFVKLRRKTRESIELVGNAAWEVIRENPEEPNSQISQVYYTPFINIRLLRIDTKPTEVEITVKKDSVHFGTMKVQRYFRRFVKRTPRHTTFFKEFGDPRVLSRKSGLYYETAKQMRVKEGKDAQVANELYHWKIESQSTPYGIPRWIGSLLAVLGSRASEEVNFMYFDNKAIPPMVLMVSGGRLSKSTVERLESYVEDKIKGRENYHKIMILEALPADVKESESEVEASGKMRIELKPLLDAQLSDGQFQEYDQNNILKVGRSFRQPQLLTGNTKDMNRSTAEVAKAFAEEQIYQPERWDFDSDMNRHFMTDQKIHFWLFVSNAPVQRIPNDLVTNIKKALDSGSITANEARKILSDAFSMDFDYIDEDWAKLPPKLALEGVRNDIRMRGGETETAISMSKIDGEIIGRGYTKTSEMDGPGHVHPFIAVRLGDRVQVSIFASDVDEHTHNVESVPFDPGQVVGLQTTENEGSETKIHAHELEFIQSNKKMEMAKRTAMALGGMKQFFQQALEDVKDDFFNPHKLQDGYE